MALKKRTYNRFFVVSICAFFFFFILGTLVFSSGEYESSCAIIRQRTTSKTKFNLSSLFSFASLTGFNDGAVGSFESIQPVLYPLVINSFDFQRDLMYSEFHFYGSDNKTTLYDFILDQHPRVFRFFSKNKPQVPTMIDESNRYYCFTEEEKICSDYIQKHVSFSYSLKNGVSIISFRTTDQIAVAEITYRIVELLQSYLEAMRADYAEGYFRIAQSQITQSSAAFRNASLALARYKDSHHELLTNKYDVNKERLDFNYLIANSQFQKSSIEYINAYVDLMEDLPLVFTISSPFIPTSKSRVDLSTLLILSFVAGITVGSLFIQSKKSIDV